MVAAWCQADLRWPGPPAPSSAEAAANAKTKEGAPDRDAQFRYQNEQTHQFRDAGLPVVSVDCKKKELIGEVQERGPR
jgi:hypothetical protein